MGSPTHEVDRRDEGVHGWGRGGEGKRGRGGKQSPSKSRPPHGSGYEGEPPPGPALRARSLDCVLQALSCVSAMGQHKGGCALPCLAHCTGDTVKPSFWNCPPQTISPRQRQGGGGQGWSVLGGLVRGGNLLPRQDPALGLAQGLQNEPSNLQEPCLPDPLFTHLRIPRSATSAPAASRDA